MPRPHALPRRQLNENPAPFPALGLRPPPVRPLTVVNVQRADKAVFDDLQSFWSYREGRSLQQCEVFALLLDVALRSGDARVAGYQPRAFLVAGEVGPGV